MIHIKICGFTRRRDVEEAIGLGVDWIGLNFWPGSPRCVSEERAAGLLSQVRPEITSVGVFVNADLETVIRAVEELGLRAVQLHGDESPEYCSRLASRLPGTLLIKALRVRTAADLRSRAAYPVTHWLLDAAVPGRYGGTGIRLDLRVVGAESLPWERIFLSGGITPDNVSEVIGKVHPFGVDVASGVEDRPGIKNTEYMRKLVLEVRRHDAA